MDDITPAPGSSLVEWSCPICSTAVPHPHRPGRARLYCTNACRQKAYRWRRRRRRSLVAPCPPQRAGWYNRAHALRSDADFVTPLADSRGRRVTACGTFAPAARDRPGRYHHPWFFASTTADHRTGATIRSSTTCRRCADVLGVSWRPIGDVLADIAASAPAAVSASRRPAPRQS